MTEDAYGISREGPHQRPQQVGLGELLMTLLDLGAKHQVAFPPGVFDCLPLMCSPSMAQWEFSAFKSCLFNSKSLWVLALLRLNTYTCLPAGSLGVGNTPTATTLASQPDPLPWGAARLSLGQGNAARHTAQMQAGTSRERTVVEAGVQR